MDELNDTFEDVNRANPENSTTSHDMKQIGSVPLCTVPGMRTGTSLDCVENDESQDVTAGENDRSHDASVYNSRDGHGEGDKDGNDDSDKHGKVDEQGGQNDQGNKHNDGEGDKHGEADKQGGKHDQGNKHNDGEQSEVAEHGEGDKHGDVDEYGDDSDSLERHQVTTSCPHAHQFVSDLSSDESSCAEQDMPKLRKQRRLKKKKKKQERLKRCCAGCDVEGAILPVSPALPSPIAVSSGMMQCNVIKSFNDVLDSLYNSEEEIDAAIHSYTTVGNRLANQHENTFSDVESQARKSVSECDSPTSDPDLLVCDYSASVGRKLANRNVDTNEDSPKNDSDEDCGGYLLDDPLKDCSSAHLSKMIQELNLKLLTVNEVLVQHVKERDDLTAEKCVIAKHISQLSRLVQGKRTNDCSAFRKILVTRETGI